MQNDNMSHKEIWKKYQETKDPALRETLILTYSHLVKYVAGRLNIYFGSNVEYEDLVSYGIFGLIDAIDKYDMNKGVKFETYASLRIRGAIIDSIREMDWVPRSLRQKCKELEKAYWEVENELGRSATDRDIAEKLNISIEELHKLLNEVNVTSLVSLEDFLEQNYEIGVEPTSGKRQDRPEYEAELNELGEILGNAMTNCRRKKRWY